ncbi:MAG TPA: PLP-dependent aminotransferase family protein [Streptosporangiaceae bacterium]
MTEALTHHDWSAVQAQRTRTLEAGEITAILALAGATDVITFSGGFPDPATFPRPVLAEIASRLIAEDAAVALQYSATEGLARLRDYLRRRIESVQGLAPAPDGLMITSGGIDCMELLAKSYVDPGDVVVVEAPTYLGGIMAFRGYEADVRGVPMDDDGMRVDVLGDRLASGLRPKIVYTIPDFQNPTGLSMSADRRQELVGLARRYGFLILEDVAYSELAFDASASERRGGQERAEPSCRGGRRPEGAAVPAVAPSRPSAARPWRGGIASLWSLAPDVVLQAGTFSKVFVPGVRLGWAAGPDQIISRLIIAKQNSDQCSGALGQRMLEEYGRGGHLDRQIIKSRALYARRAALLDEALTAHMPPETTWTRPAGGFYIWVTAPDGVDTVALAGAARDRKVAYVPGQPFYPDRSGRAQMRLAYSRVADDLIDEGVRRIAAVIRTALENTALEDK